MLKNHWQNPEETIPTSTIPEWAIWKMLEDEDAEDLEMTEDEISEFFAVDDVSTLKSEYITEEEASMEYADAFEEADRAEKAYNAYIKEQLRLPKESELHREFLKLEREKRQELKERGKKADRHQNNNDATNHKYPNDLHPTFQRDLKEVRRILGTYIELDEGYDTEEEAYSKIGELLNQKVSEHFTKNANTGRKNSELDSDHYLKNLREVIKLLRETALKNKINNISEIAQGRPLYAVRSERSVKLTESVYQANMEELRI